MSEIYESERDGARLQKNSGRGKHAKGDAVLGPFVIDYKEYAKSFSVSISNWAKISKDAVTSGNYQPAFKLILGEGPRVTRLWVISDDMFHEMYEAWKKEHNE